VTVTAYLRVPSGGRAGATPCVVLIGGLESTKEESYRFENDCLLRGLATCVFDGPGQGETLFGAKIRADFERFTSAILDVLVAHPALDARRIGILGRSLGGNYALRSAAADHRLACCAAWSTRAHMDYWTELPLQTQQLYAYAAGFGLDELVAAGRHVQHALDIRPILGMVRCPVYIQHGAQDPSIRQADAETLAAGLRGAAGVQLEMISDGNHCSHNCAQRARPALVDWLVRQLVDVDRTGR
jgi:2,6-dihydroxypseudooxynicotine hydrolase